MSELMPYIITGVCGIFVAVIEALAARERKAAKADREAAEQERIEAQKQRESMAAEQQRLSSTIAGVRALLYIEIKSLCRKYIARGYIECEDLEDLIMMHEIYHDDLEGNGFLDSLMNAVKALPKMAKQKGAACQSE